MKKLLLIACLVGSLFAAEQRPAMDGYAIACSMSPLQMDLRGDLAKVEQACSECLKSVPMTGIDKTEETMKYLTSQCVAEYKKQKQ